MRFRLSAWTATGSTSCALGVRPGSAAASAGSTTRWASGAWYDASYSFLWPSRGSLVVSSAPGVSCGSSAELSSAELRSAEFCASCASLFSEFCASLSSKRTRRAWFRVTAVMFAVVSSAFAESRSTYSTSWILFSTCNSAVRSAFRITRPALASRASVARASAEAL
ncbi:hypothetical protein PR002_g18855 [Phytophthora rubi]|uniref:Uncharacterized protein n=1 Tax=Phytophthora rubi TaxID=129364 RepID=A0A6A3K072_9STRA|nr:hypothetical protein PR002_g18855 [Phytophthora rubi]